MGADQGQLRPDAKPIAIRQVWAHNLDHEFFLIRIVLRHYRYVSMDTEFPGVIFAGGGRDPHHQYSLMKKNVDATKLIQVGLTFADHHGNLPDIGTPARFIWEFNFKGFDAARDPHSPDSVALLRRQGIDFERNMAEGIDPHRFAELMVTAGLLGQAVTWVTFHGAYDFAYLVKTLTRSDQLPAQLEEFLGLVRAMFGDRVYDVKYMMRFSNGLYGGLERVAKALEVDRAVGKCHQAGSDSLLTWRAFQKMAERSLINARPERLAGMLYGLDIDNVR